MSGGIFHKSKHGSSCNFYDEWSFIGLTSEFGHMRIADCVVGQVVGAKHVVLHNEPVGNGV